MQNTSELDLRLALQQALNKRLHALHASNRGDFLNVLHAVHKHCPTVLNECATVAALVQ